MRAGNSFRSSANACSPLASAVVRIRGMSNSALPNESQRQQLCELMHFAFLELRSVNDQSEQVYDLAYAFHNLPLTMYGWAHGASKGSEPSSPAIASAILTAPIILHCSTQSSIRPRSPVCGQGAGRV
jgi:hypothetical protein